MELLRAILAFFLDAQLDVVSFSLNASFPIHSHLHTESSNDATKASKFGDATKSANTRFAESSAV
jgi:hypothetical protein